MVVTEPDAEPHRRASMILVPTDTPGYELVRRIPVMGHEGRGWGTHCETRFTGVRVPVANTLGEPGDGFRIAQKRLGPGRIHHVMRWLGQMQRAFELMCAYALEREAFGGPLAEKQTIQNWIAESAAEIQACRLMTMQAAQRIDEGDEARVEISLIKFYAARVLSEVIDRAIQVHGGLGITDDTPLALMWRHGARRRGSTTGPTRCTRRSSRGASCASFEDGGRLALHVDARGRARPARAARAAARGGAVGGRAGSAHLALDARPRRREPRARSTSGSRSVEHGLRALLRRRARRAHELPQRPARRPRRRDRQHLARTRRRGGRARTPRRSTSSCGTRSRTRATCASSSRRTRRTSARAPRSQQVGATFEGVFRKHMLVRGGERRDSAWYAVIDDDWPEVKASLERRLAS